MSPFELKGRTTALTVLRLHTDNLDEISGSLAARAAGSPGYFKNSLCMIDLEGLQTLQSVQSRRGGLHPSALDLTALVATLRGLGMAPVLLKGGDAAQQAAAVSLGLALAPEEPASRRVAQEAPVPEASKPESESQPLAQEAQPALVEEAPVKAEVTPVEPEQAPIQWGCKVVRQTVRAGQRVYARDGDLVVFGAVNPGAEVMADGSIHIYGALRGRAMAGARGNELGRIFCQQLFAEMLAVAGVYLTSETLDPGLRGRPAQALLRDGRLAVELLEPSETKTAA